MNKVILIKKDGIRLGKWNESALFIGKPSISIDQTQPKVDHAKMA